MREEIAVRDPIELYLENVLCYADLAARDERSVRAELAEHLHVMAVESKTSNPKEIYAMLNEQFGSEKKLGRAIAAAKGRVRTFFKKRKTRWPIQIAIVLVLAFAVRFAVAQAFYVTGDGASPVVPRGSRVLVYKLASSFSPGDVVVFRHNGEFLIGIVNRQMAENRWLIEKTIAGKKEMFELTREEIVGRVFLNTR
jgi:hypothetical protein